MEHIPYGYRIENGIAVVDEMAAEQVRHMFENYLKGDSLTKAAENADINANHSSVKLMLQNSRYLGDGFYPKIISKETFNAAANERENRAERLGRKGRTKEKRSAIIPLHFSFENASDYFNDPARQAEYMYGLIRNEAKNIE